MGEVKIGEKARMSRHEKWREEKEGREEGVESGSEENKKAKIRYRRSSGSSNEGR